MVKLPVLLVLKGISLIKNRHNHRQIDYGFKQLAETAIDGIIGSDVSLRISYWNKAAEKVFGYSREEAIGMNLMSVIPMKYIDNYHELVTDLESPITKLIGETIEIEGLTKEGEIFPIEVSWNSWVQKGNTIFLVFVRDIKERKKAEQELEDLNKALLEDSKQLLKIKTKAFVSGQEREKKRIAKDLHDGLGQVLSGVKRNFLSFCETVKRDDIQWDQALLVEKLLLSSISELRKISSGLLPSVLRDFGWLEAIEDLSLQFVDIEIKFAIDPNIRKMKISEEDQVHLYRIFQEAFTNSYTHGKCKNIAVAINEKEKHLLIQIKDDGIGFVYDKKRQKNKMVGGYGIFNMHERVNLLGGIMNLKSGIGNGTDISISVPLLIE